MHISMKFFGPHEERSAVGLVVVLLGLLKSHAIIGLIVAAYVLVDPLKLDVYAESAGETNDSMFLTDRFGGDATANNESYRELGNAAGVDHVHTDYDVVPMAFHQPGADPRPATPSYLDPKSPVDESLPEPSYLDEEAEELPLSEQLEQFNQRLRELEAAKIANEDATRSIIRRSFAERGSNITDAVVFGGTIETLTFWADDFDGTSQSDIVLDTAELDFEILVNPWVLGSLVIEYDDGTNLAFPNDRRGRSFVLIESMCVRRFITIGDTANYPLFATTGRDVVPFGISTGDPVADVLTIVDPLTVEVFEMREDFIMIGFVGPTCCPPPASTTQIPAPAKPRPMLFNPAGPPSGHHLLLVLPVYSTRETTAGISAAAHLHPALFAGPSIFSTATPLTAGTTTSSISVARWAIARKARCPNGIPWTVDLDVDFTSSVFDSNFSAV